MASPLAKYAFINAKVRARISKILPDGTFDQLARAPSLEAALALLRETPFAHLEETYAATGDLKQAELELFIGTVWSSSTLCCASLRSTTSKTQSEFSSTRTFATARLTPAYTTFSTIVSFTTFPSIWL